MKDRRAIGMVPFGGIDDEWLQRDRRGAWREVRVVLKTDVLVDLAWTSGLLFRCPYLAQLHEP